MAVGPSESEAAEFSDRYQIHVGIDRGTLVAKFVEVVPLPDGWTYGLDKVINDGQTLNVGDVVEIRTSVGSRIIPADDEVVLCPPGTSPCRACPSRAGMGR